MKNTAFVSFIVGIVIVFNLSLQDSFASESNGKTFTVEASGSVEWRFNSDRLAYEGNNLLMRKTGVYTVHYTNSDGQVLTKSVFYNAATNSVIKLIVIGDSTASYYSSGSYPRTGWAQVFQNFFNEDSVDVVDKALSGRSSKSFYTDPSGWPAVKPTLSSGDYLFIQFGHNDSKDDAERHTEPYTTFKEYLKKYIDEARSSGAIPVLLTPINRNSWSGSSVTDTHGEYDDAMRELAMEESVPLFDMTVKTKFMMEGFGKDFSTNELFMNLPPQEFPNYPDGNSDNTHLQERGAYEVCKLVAESLMEYSDEPELKKLNNSLQQAGFIDVSYNAFNLGRVTGAGVVPMNEVVKLTARPASGFVLAGYFKGEDLLSSENVYEFEMTDAVLNITAVFETGYKVNLSVDPKYKGRASGSGTYAEGDSVSVVAIPYSGYRFLNWTMDGEVVSTDSLYTFVMDTVNLAIQANFILENTPVDFVDAQTKLFWNSGINAIHVESPYRISSITVLDVNGRILKQVNPQNQNTKVVLNKSVRGIILVRLKTEKSEIIRKLMAK